MRNFVEGIQYIGRPLNSNGNGATLDLNAWITVLEDYGQQLANDVAGDNFGTGKEGIRKLNRQLSTIVSKRQVLLEFEIGDLRAFSRSLYDRLA